MQVQTIRKRLFKDNSYLLLASALLLLISLFTQRRNSFGDKRRYAGILEHYIKTAENNFKNTCADTALIGRLAAGTETETEISGLAAGKEYLFIYRNTGGFQQLRFWSTQSLLPPEELIAGAKNSGIIKLVNGYYFLQKCRQNNITVLSLLPVKWNYFISNDYLKNEFAAAAAEGRKFDISFEEDNSAVRDAEHHYLFSLVYRAAGGKSAENILTVMLRLLSLLPLLLFIHFTASRIYIKNGVVPATFFLAGTLFLLRLITYFFPVPVSFRQFELFDPAIYGSGIVLRSLGDLLINAALFFWVINFVKNHLKKKYSEPTPASALVKWLAFAAGVLTILYVTYTATGILRSMVADSQISFDVIDFFSLNQYSVIGFLVLCCIAIGYYYFCRVILFFLKMIFPGFMMPFFLATAITGLLILSFRIGELSGGFELYGLIWLLLFLTLVKSDLAGFFSTGLFVSKTVFWLFFFSASVAAVIITENNRKELRNRQHYAELIATKTDPISEVLLSTMLTEFRPGMLADKFPELTGERTAGPFRDSLINNNFNGYTDKYDTKVLVYDSTEQPLFNGDPISYNSINSIVNTQAKPASVEGLYIYDGGYDKFSYIARRTIKDFTGTLLGYAFILISPRNFENEMLYPELFGHGQNNSIENSTGYAYAIYEKGRLISSHNDYAFSTRYTEKYFAGSRFILDENKKYSELWYNAGNGKYIVIVKENRVLLELITLFSYLFCSFLILSALSRLLSLLLRSRLRPARIKNEIRLTIRQQVHGTVIFFSAASFIIIGVATILFFISRYEKNNKETLSRTIRVMEKDLSAVLTKDMVQTTAFQNAQSSAPSPVQTAVSRISEVHGPDVNLYSSTGDLKASSLPLPYIKGILSTKMDPLAFYHLNQNKEIQYFQEEHIGDLNFVSEYIPVTDSSGNEIAYLNIPYFTSQSKLKEEISGFLVTIINLNAFIFLIAGIVALIITNRITRSFTFISEKMKKINLGKRNEAIVWRRDDEIGALVKEYNRMLAKLDESAAALARTERESAWQEMARQVAHEIKNPLTPMKLSMQFLQKSIENNAPDIKELGARVSATLVEQIDHLSTIAGEFSRFADIENAKPELFNLNEALRSVQQLYEGDSRNSFQWELTEEPLMVYADKTHINRMLTNLILNGIQAVPAGKKPHITVIERVKENNAEIQITDNGSGISDEAKGKIFTPNFTTKSSGTGLGLAMCKRMAEQAGGDISYETSAAGTSFFVTLPIVGS